MNEPQKITVVFFAFILAVVALFLTPMASGNHGLMFNGSAERVDFGRLVIYVAAVLAVGAGVFFAAAVKKED